MQIFIFIVDLCYSTCRLAIPSTDCPKIIHTSYYAPTSTEQLLMSIDTEKIEIENVSIGSNQLAVALWFSVFAQIRYF